MKYLRKTLNGHTTVAIKIMNHETLWCFDNQISGEDNDLQNIQNEIDHQIDEGFIECTQQEFDEFFIKTSKYINELSSK